jgi:hypothetical protein
MKLYGLIDILPFWGLLIFTGVLILLSYEAGFRAGKRRRQRVGHEPEVVVRSLVVSMSSLLTFLLAFTFWLAATHFDAVRQAKINEANAIRTVYLRADLLPEPSRAEIRDLLRQYVDIRLQAVQTGNFERVIHRSEELQNRLWSLAVAAREKTSSPIFGGYFIQSLNEMIALHTRRLVVGLDYRIPDAIWVVLYLITILAAGSIGCHAGLNGTKRPLVAPAFIFIFSVVMVMIADLDRPSSGMLRVSQQILIDLRRSMDNL